MRSLFIHLCEGTSCVVWTASGGVELGCCGLVPLDAQVSVVAFLRLAKPKERPGRRPGCATGPPPPHLLANAATLPIWALPRVSAAQRLSLLGARLEVWDPTLWSACFPACRARGIWIVKYRAHRCFSLLFCTTTTNMYPRPRSTVTASLGWRQARVTRIFFASYGHGVRLHTTPNGIHTW